MLLDNSQPSFYQQYFAKNMQSFSGDYDKLVGPIKAELFSRLFSSGDITNLVEVRSYCEHIIHKAVGWAVTWSSHAGQLGIGTGVNFPYLVR